MDKLKHVQCMIHSIFYSSGA